MNILRMSILGMFLAAIGTAGCSSNHGGNTATTQEETALSEVGDMIRSVIGSAGRPPNSVADFGKLSSMYSNGYKAVKSGDIVVVWGAKVAGEGSSGGTDDSIVAYEKNAPTSGGFVLLASGKVTKLTAAEISNVLKVKK